MRRTFLPLALLLVGCATAQSQSSLAGRIHAITSPPALHGAIWGIDIVDGAGRTLYARHEGTLLIPASNRKLFAAATVASCQGLDHQILTELWREGDDVVIRGGGDPSLGGRWAFDRDAVFAPFIAELRRRSVTEVRDVIADVSLFDRVTIPGTWKVGNLGSDYATPVDALAYNENVVGIVADNCASPVVIADPAFVMTTAAVRCGRGGPVVRSDAMNAVTLAGSMPDHDQSLIGIGDPARYAAQAFRDALQHAGIRVTGAIVENYDLRLWSEKLASIPSPPLWQLLSVMLKPSQNLYAEMLFKGLSATDSRPASYEVSEDVERRFLTEDVGIADGDFRFADGSGLSPDDLVAPRAVVQLLQWMNEPGRRAAWSMMLARPGEEGTLRRRLLPFTDRLRAKTGSINGVNALSGILAGPDGTYRYFSIIINHHTADTSDALHAIDAIVGEIAK